MCSCAVVLRILVRVCWGLVQRVKGEKQTYGIQGRAAVAPPAIKKPRMHMARAARALLHKMSREATEEAHLTACFLPLIVNKPQKDDTSAGTPFQQ